MRILLAVMILSMCSSVYAQRSRVRENIRQQTSLVGEKTSNKKIEITGVAEEADSVSTQKKSNSKKSR